MIVLARCFSLRTSANLDLVVSMVAKLPTTPQQVLATMAVTVATLVMFYSWVLEAVGPVALMAQVVMALLRLAQRVLGVAEQALLMVAEMARPHLEPQVAMVVITSLAQATE
jgi:hypothetical protein